MSVKQVKTGQLRYLQPIYVPVVEWCVLLLQVDALCPKRGSDGSGGSEQDKRVVSTVLTLLDGLHHPLPSTEGRDKKAVLVIATTSKPDAVDPALRRPGRYNGRMLTCSSPLPTSKSPIYSVFPISRKLFSVLISSSTWASLF